MKSQLDRLQQPGSWAPVALAALALAVPLVTRDPYYLSVLIVVGLYALVGTGLCLLMGHAGQVSLGQAGFYAIGAYTSGLLSVKLDLGPWLGLAAGVVLAMAVAYAVGYLTLRLQEHYLALATLGFGIIVFIIVNEWVRVTGGASGLRGIPPLSIGGVDIRKDLHFYFVVWPLVLAGMVLYRNVVHSRVGRALHAVHGSEYAAEALGIDVPAYKLQVFVLSAAYASLAGGLYAHWITFISPPVFSFITSIHFLIIGVLGGLASLWGPILGAAAFVILKEALHDIVPVFIPSAGGQYESAVFGVLVVALLIFMPEGLGGAVERLVRWLALPMRGLSAGKGGGR